VGLCFPIRLLRELKYRDSVVLFAHKLLIFCAWSETLPSLDFTSVSQISSTSKCRGFTKSLPSLTVSSYDLYSISFNSSFLQNLLYSFFPSVPGSSFESHPLWSSLEAILGMSHLPFLQCAQTISTVLILIEGNYS